MEFVPAIKVSGIIDPANISVDNGVIKFELVNYDYYFNGEKTEPSTLMKGLDCISGEEVQGILLVEMIEDGKLKMEIFPDKTASEVNDFTDDFRIYNR